MNKRELLKILRYCIEQFYSQDSYLIDDIHKVHEQAIAYRIAHYFENICYLYNPSFYITHNFDVEYNKNLNDPKYIFNKCWKCQNIKCSCQQYEAPQGSRPDFLIHKRGTNEQNKFIVEFKTGDSKQKDIQYDVNKLKYFTCPEGEYKYLFGCFVYLKKNSYKIEIFEKGKKISLKIYDKK